MSDVMDLSTIEHAIDHYRGMKARRYRLAKATEAIAEEISALDEDLADAEADLAVQLRDEGPATIDGREYSHGRRDGCDVVEVRPAPEPSGVGDDPTIPHGLGRRNAPEVCP